MVEVDILVINAALELSRKYVEDESYNWTWKTCTETFSASLVPK